jgi:hypothetical protein
MLRETMRTCAGLPPFAVASLLLNLFLLGWLAWIVADPHYWFPGAYAEKRPAATKAQEGLVGQLARQGP